MTMKTISKAFASRLIDYAPRNAKQASSLADAQLDGAVAAYNMLARNEVAYIADEVGMGKTYIALGVLGLLRHLNPKAKAMVITPRENIQKKWEKEFLNFVRVNWKIEDNRFKDLQGIPVRPPIACDNFHDIGSTILRREDCDMLLRMTTFSVAINDPERRNYYANQINRISPWIGKMLHKCVSKEEFIVLLGYALNGLIPDLDLLIVDEAHNLRRGLGPRASNRNRLLAIMLGHGECGVDQPSWYRPKARRILLLSATPFEYDYSDIFRQLDVLGKGDTKLMRPKDPDFLQVSNLNGNDPDSEHERKAIVRRLMIRRVRHMTIAGMPHSKNMYRREWRNGGYNVHDEPLSLTNERERLVVALIQKKVTELLGEKRFKDSFQIGMLSSFESFLESFRHNSRTREPETQAVDDEPTSGFDLREQTDNERERQGIDTSHIETVVKSYRKRFGEALPHPKLDATCNSVSRAFETGEKALIFVRRVATVGELKTRLDRQFDEWICKRMLAQMPSLGRAVCTLFDRYHKEKQCREKIKGNDEDRSHDKLDDTAEFNFHHELFEDKGGIDTFFAWFFRGGGPEGVLSGAAFRRNRFGSAAPVYSIFFDDDLVAWLLGHPGDVLASLASAIQIETPELKRRLRNVAYAYYQQRTNQKERYPRLYIYEAYQVAALALLAESRHSLRDKSAVVLDERFGGWALNEATPPPNFPAPDAGLGIQTFITELQKRRGLCADIWPDETKESDLDDFRNSFRRREQRRELLSAMCRLGASYIDLYLAAIKQIGSFGSGADAPAEHTAIQLAEHFLELLENQRTASGWSAYTELRAAAKAFDTIVAVNFPDLPTAQLVDLPAMLARTLQHQVPVAGMSGRVNKRVVRQFRMPGFPLILASTDVLQEGEDLHTFCRRVIHYGIAWTPSAVEQRTGRIDRIDSLVQRELEGRLAPPDEGEFIQVHYPHLSDTIEVLQIRRVLQRINDFLALSHRDITMQPEYDSRLRVDTEILRDLKPIPQFKGLLCSDFDDTASWLAGKLGPESIHQLPIKELEDRFASIWRWVAKELVLESVHKPSARKRQAAVTLSAGALVRPDAGPRSHCRRQSFTLALRAQLEGDDTLVRCSSPVGRMDLQDPDTLDRLYDLQRKLGDVRVCARLESTGRRFHVTVEEERCFHLEATQLCEIRQLIERTVVAADTIEQELLAVDAPVHAVMMEGT